MEYDEIVKTTAPCGLSCGKCVAFKGGSIQAHAQGLAELLGENFSAYAKRFEAMQPVFANYPAFRELLDFLALGQCSGCRGQGCLFTACEVRTCVKDQSVDFCFQCAEFPCARHGMPPRLEEVWKKNNEKMRDMGVEAYHEKFKDKPRYP